MRLRPLLALLPCICAVAQIPFESGGLHYQTLTKGGVTVMFAPLPSHISHFDIMQIAVSNGSPISWNVRPEDFSYRLQDGSTLAAVPALTVVNSLLEKASRRDVIKLVTTYEAGVYGNIVMHTTNGYERRRQGALSDSGARFKAAAAASAIVLVSTKIQSGESTDGAIFFPGNGKPLGPGTLIVHAAGEVYEFASAGETVSSK